MLTPFFIHWAENLSQQGQQKLEFDLLLDTNKITALQDHFFSGQCLLPGAMVGEIMMQAVAILSGKQNVFPLILKQMDIVRGIAISPGGSRYAYVCCEHVSGNCYRGEITTDITNSTGKVIRQRVRVATAEFELTCEPPSFADNSDNDNQDMEYFCFEQKYLYDNFIATHGELFKSLTGKITSSKDKTKFSCSFNIQDKENKYSTQANLPFVISPLGFDSILQVAVLSRTLNPPVGQTCYHSKLPVQIRQFYLAKPFEFHHQYLAQGVTLGITETEQTMQFSVFDNTGQRIATIERVGLKKSPYYKRIAVSVVDDLEQHRVTEGEFLCA